VPAFLARSNRRRTALLIGAAVVLVAVVALILANTGSSGSDHNPGRASPGSSATTTTTTLVLEIGPVSVQSAGPPAGVRHTAQLALMRATQQYFADAIQAPLLHGKVDNDYAKIFDPGVRAPATGKDRPTLTERPTRALHGVHMSASRVRLDGLADPAGKLTLVATTFTLRIEASAPTGPLVIRRNTELTFANEFGHWVVTAYRVNVQRASGANTTSTTARSGTGTTA
jgi:hypothetical protein